MVVRKKKKVLKQRAKTWHGMGKGGAHNKGAGNRGGRGRAGTGKRGDANKPKVWKNGKYFGKYGFKSKSRSKVKAINVSYIDSHIDVLLDKKLITKDKESYIVDLDKLGFNKLLGSGPKLKNKLKITAENFTERAKSKVERAGGEAIIKETREKKEALKKETEKKSDKKDKDTKDNKKPEEVKNK